MYVKPFHFKSREHREKTIDNEILSIKLQFLKDYVSRTLFMYLQLLLFSFSANLKIATWLKWPIYQMKKHNLAQMAQVILKIEFGLVREKVE